MAKIKILVDGPPIPKGRPRSRIVTKRDGTQFISFYTPKETESYEGIIRWSAKSAMSGKSPLDCSCEVKIKAFIEIPDSWSGKKSTAALHGTILPISKPDIDNYAKIALDAMNGIVFIDDSRVWKLECEKLYSNNPRLEIEVRETNLFLTTKGEKNDEK